MDYSKAVEYRQFVIAQEPIVQNATENTEAQLLGTVLLHLMIHENFQSRKELSDIYTRLYLAYHLTTSPRITTQWLSECYEKVHGKLAPVFDLANMTGI